jgi:hypothetical protein
MGVANFFNVAPLLQNFRTKLIFAHLAQILNLRFVGTALAAEVIKENVNFEVIRQNFSFVFPNIFRTKLHFATLDIVSVLNESCIEH